MKKIPPNEYAILCQEQKRIVCNTLYIQFLQQFVSDVIDPVV